LYSQSLLVLEAWYSQYWPRVPTTNRCILCARFPVSISFDFFFICRTVFRYYRQQSTLACDPPPPPHPPLNAHTHTHLYIRCGPILPTIFFLFFFFFTHTCISVVDLSFHAGWRRARWGGIYGGGVGSWIYGEGVGSRRPTCGALPILPPPSAGPSSGCRDLCCCKDCESGGRGRHEGGGGQEEGDGDCGGRRRDITILLH